MSMNWERHDTGTDASAWTDAAALAGVLALLIAAIVGVVAWLA